MSTPYSRSICVVSSSSTNSAIVRLPRPWAIWTIVWSALQSHPAVAEAAVVVPRDREPSEELARELQEHCKRETAPYKFPRIVDFVTELPKTSTGKIRRADFRRG
jgi:acyl-coenzyme A synthetase/AMP-(fatty) acid ligase